MHYRKIESLLSLYKMILVHESLKTSKTKKGIKNLNVQNKVIQNQDIKVTNIITSVNKGCSNEKEVIIQQYNKTLS